MVQQNILIALVCIFLQFPCLLAVEYNYSSAAEFLPFGEHYMWSVEPDTSDNTSMKRNMKRSEEEVETTEKGKANKGSNDDEEGGMMDIGILTLPKSSWENSTFLGRYCMEEECKFVFIVNDTAPFWRAIEGCKALEMELWYLWDQMEYDWILSVINPEVEFWTAMCYYGGEDGGPTAMPAMTYRVGRPLTAKGLDPEDFKCLNCPPMSDTVAKIFRNACLTIYNKEKTGESERVKKSHMQFVHLHKTFPYICQKGTNDGPTSTTPKTSTSTSEETSSSSASRTMTPDTPETPDTDMTDSSTTTTTSPAPFNFYAF